ncbi:MAG TPA: hypothetical protein VFW74_03840 [Acidimicrobiia bacterium]|jgi:hypothetical protein|nr:hypothetical protein [Acidimicrobiia bacterium]
MGVLLLAAGYTTKTGPRHLAEIAAIVGGVGAIITIVGGAFGLGLLPGRDAAGRFERIGYIVGAFLVGLAFLLLLIAIHGGFGSIKPVP